MKGSKRWKRKRRIGNCPCCDMVREGEEQTRKWRERRDSLRGAE